MDFDYDYEDTMDMEYDLVPMPMYMQMGMGGRNMPMMPMMPEMAKMFNMMNEEETMELGQEEYGNFEIEELRKKEGYNPSDINKILRKIERYNPGIFRYMAMYGIPYPEARRLVRRIIRLTLMYSDY